jgi:hypothetical protein
MSILTSFPALEKFYVARQLIMKIPLAKDELANLANNLLANRGSSLEQEESCR